VGQVLDRSRPDPQLGSVPVVLHGQTGLLGVAKTNEFGEFHFDFDAEQGVTLEIGVRGNHWVLLDVPDTKVTIAETPQELELAGPAGNYAAQKDLRRSGKRRARR
jgi:hypothetical protein